MNREQSIIGKVHALEQMHACFQLAAEERRPGHGGLAPCKLPRTSAACCIPFKCSAERERFGVQFLSEPTGALSRPAMASGPLIPLSDGKVAEDSRAEDEEEMRRLRAAGGKTSRVGGRRSGLPPMVCSCVSSASASPLGNCEVGPCSRRTLLSACPASAPPSSQTAKRQAYLEAAAGAGAAEEDPELRAELDAAAVPA